MSKARVPVSILVKNTGVFFRTELLEARKTRRERRNHDKEEFGHEADVEDPKPSFNYGKILMIGAGIFGILSMTQNVAPSNLNIRFQILLFNKI